MAGNLDRVPWLPAEFRHGLERRARPGAPQCLRKVGSQRNDLEWQLPSDAGVHGNRVGDDEAIEPGVAQLRHPIVT